MSTESLPAVSVRNRDIINIFRALTALDGAEEAVRVKGEGAEPLNAVIVRPYVFGGKTRLVVARWLTRIREANDELSKVHDALVKQFSDPADSKRVAVDQMVAFTEQWQAVMDESREFQLATLPFESLNAEQNKIPVTVLAALEPICA